MRPLLSIVIALVLWTAPSYAQRPPAKRVPANPFILGVVDTIRSATLQETRKLNIYLPDGYTKQTAASYPVIYLLDGSRDEDFIHIVGLVQFMTMIQAMPASIVVGIGNVDRKRDFTFPTTIAKDKQDYPTTGSSEKFRTFLQQELQPFVQQKYSSNTTTTIIGQSLGGLVATEILLKQPDLFSRYIIISPSLWWDKESLLAAAPALLAQQPDHLRQVYISVGTEGAQMEQDAKMLTDLLKKAGNKNLTVHYVPLPEENHLTILHHSVYKAFEVLNAKK